MNKVYRKLFSVFFNDNNVSWFTKLVSILAFVIILQSLLVFSKDNYYIYFPLFVFSLYLYTAVFNDPYDSGLGSFIEFIRNYPVNSLKLVGNHIIYRLFNKDQLITYTFLLVILIINSRDLGDIFLFFLLLFIVLTIPLFIEYTFSLIKLKPHYIIISQLFVTILILGLSQFRFNIYLIRDYFVGNSFIIIGIISIIILFVGLWSFKTMLTTDRVYYFNNKVLEGYSFILSKLIRGLDFSRYSNTINLIIYFIKRSLRDKVILNKLMFVLSLAAVIAVLTNSNGQNSVLNDNRLILLISIYYFSSFHLYTKDHFQKFLYYFPIKIKEFKVAKDFSVGTIFLSISFILIIIEGVITNKLLIQMFTSSLNLLVLYFFSLCFIVEKKKIKKNLIQIIYMLVALLYLLLFESLILINIVVLVALISLYFYLIKIKEEQIKNYYLL